MGTLKGDSATYEILVNTFLEDAAVLGKAHFLNFRKSTLGNVYISLSVDTLPSWVGRCDAFANRQ